MRGRVGGGARVRVTRPQGYHGAGPRAHGAAGGRGAAPGGSFMADGGAAGGARPPARDLAAWSEGGGQSYAGDTLAARPSLRHLPPGLAAAAAAAAAAGGGGSYGLPPGAGGEAGACVC